MDRRGFLKGASAPIVAGFILTKVSEKTLLGQRTFEEPEDGITHVQLELYGLKGDFADPLLESELVDSALTTKFAPKLDCLHRWLMKTRLVTLPFDPQKSITGQGPRVKFYPVVDHVYIENDTGEKLWVVRCVGEVLSLPGLMFEVDLGSGKFQDVAFGASFRPQGSGGNEPFWLMPGNRLTLEWGGGRPVAEIG